MKICFVKFTSDAIKDITKIPLYIEDKLRLWAEAVTKSGINAVRKIPGYHDEALKGKRTGQRSIRLNKSYRAIYVEDNGKEVNIISIIEVNKHEY